MTVKDDIRRCRNALFTTGGKLKDVKDLVTLMGKLESPDDFAKRKKKSPLAVWVPHMKIIKRFFETHGGLTKIKLYEPWGDTPDAIRASKKRCEDSYKQSILTLRDELSVPDDKVPGKNTCSSNQSYPYHLVQWRYVNVEEKKYKCDNIIFKGNLYVVLHSANGFYFELRDKNGIREFPKLDAVLQSAYVKLCVHNVCGNTIPSSIMYFDGDKMMRESKIAVAQSNIEVFYRSCSEAVRLEPVEMECRERFLDEDWTTYHQISSANVNYIQFWGDMTEASRGNESKLNYLMENGIVTNFDDMINKLKVLNSESEKAERNAEKSRKKKNARD